MVGVSVDQDVLALQTFAAQQHLSFPIGRDPDQSVANRYGTFQFPETYIIDQDGRVAEKLIGVLPIHGPDHYFRPGTRPQDGRLGSWYI